jgi:hypothetical protein
MSDSAFFKVKSSKRSNPEARTTLDAIHNQKIQKMIEEKISLTCPASILQSHPNVTVYFDKEASKLVSQVIKNKYEIK